MNNQIIIAAPSYNPSIGGSIVLHKLCHILNNLGYNSSLTTTMKLNGQVEFFALNPEYNTKIANEININNDIIIYPEIQPGNPYGCKNVVRYILNKFHLPQFDNSVATWHDKDFWLYFHELFYDGLREPNYLHIIDSGIDKFVNLGMERKYESCHTYRKRSHEKNSLNKIHPEDSILIEYNTPYSELVLWFNQCKRFYSYDTETYLSVLALLCGCESIIVPYPGLTKEDIVTKQPSFKYGIAYGIEDLHHGIMTSQLLVKHLQTLEDEQITNVMEKFNKIIKYFNLADNI